MEISASLFDLDEAEAVNVSREKVNRLKAEILRRYKEESEAQERRERALREERQERAR